MNQPSKIEMLLIEIEESNNRRLAYEEADGRTMLDHLARRSTHVQWVIIEAFVCSASPGERLAVFLDNKRDALLVRVS